MSQPSFCATKEIKTNSFLLRKFKQNFYEEIKSHYDKLVRDNIMSESEKAQALKKYENPDISVCPNPENTSQKIVYIEYEKNWWGHLYFAFAEGNNILKWIAVETYGAVVQHIQWNEKSFFYKDSTHTGTKTENTCMVQENSFQCKEIKKYR